MSRRRAKANWEGCGLDRDRRELGRKEALLEVAEEEKRGYGVSSSTFFACPFLAVRAGFLFAFEARTCCTLDNFSSESIQLNTQTVGFQSLHRSLLAPSLGTSTTFFAVSIW